MDYFIIKTITFQLPINSMFRIARLLNIAKPCINTNFPIFVPSTLFSKNLACFTETPQLKIAEMIEDENLITKLDAFAQ